VTAHVGDTLADPQRHRGRRRKAVGGILLLGLLGCGVALWTTVATTESPLRTIPLPAPGGVVVDERAGRAVVASSGPRGSLYTLDTHTGDILSTITLGSGFISDMAVATGRGYAFVLSRASRNLGRMDLSTVDTRTGALLRTVTVPVTSKAVAVDGQTEHLFVVSMGAQKGDGTPLGPGNVRLLDARSGALIRVARVGLQPWAVAVDHATHRVFVANYRSHTVSVLDVDTGRVVRTALVGKGPVAVATDDVTGRVFVANEDSGTVSMLDARTGVVLGTITTGSPNAIAVDARAGRIVVTNGGLGTVDVIDAKSGAIVNTVTVGGSPMDVAIDNRTGRAFVTDTQAHRALFVLLRPVVGGRLSWAGENNDDGVSVIDTRSGTLLRTVRVGAAAGVAVDRQTGHAFVVSPGSNSVSMLDATR